MKQNTRRNFLKGLALGSAALAIPQWVPATAMGRDGAVAPSERITMGLIGCGIHGHGWNLDAMLANPEQQVVAVCDVDRDHKDRTQKKIDDSYSAKFGAEYKGCSAYNDFRDLVNRKDIDAIDIVTPDHWHSLLAIYGMKAGKHVICEKPTLTIAEGRLVSNVQKQTGRVFLTASENKTIDMYQDVVNVVRNGKIGQVQHITVLLPPSNGKRGTLSHEIQPIPAELDYEKWIGPAKMIPYIPARTHNTWRWHLYFSGGALTDWGSHNTHLAQWALDTEMTGPIEIEAKNSEYPPNDAVWTTTPNFDVLCRYANGVTMQIVSEVPGIRFEGTNGWIMIRGYRGKVTASDEALLTWKPGPNDLDIAKDLKYCTIGPTGILGNSVLGGEHVHFTHCIKTGQTPYYTAETGHRTHTIGHLAQIAMKLGNVKLQWNPDTEQIEGENAEQAKASMFYQREQRDPWTFDNVDSWINIG